MVLPENLIIIGRIEKHVPKSQRRLISPHQLEVNIHLQVKKSDHSELSKKFSQK